MVLLENKLDLFYDIVYKKREEVAKEKLDILIKEIQGEKELKESELKKREEDLIERRASLGKIKGNEIISQAIEERRSSHLKQTSQLLNIFTDRILDKSREFTKNDDYKNYLLERLDKLLKSLDSGVYNIAITKMDLDRYSEDIIEIGVRNKIEFIFNELSDEKIGGFIISDKESSYNFNLTILDKVLNHKYDLGKILHQIFEEEGEDIE